MNEEEVERKSLKDLESLLREAQNQGIRLVIIGGYAVAAYTRGHRFTKDIDLVADKPTLGKLIGLLKTLGYVTRDTEFGIAGNKKLNDAFIDLHISVGRIYDISTGKEYRVNASLFEDAKDLIVKGYVSKATSLRATVVELDTLVILKIMPVGRDKDAVDLLSLLRDKRNELSLDVIAERAKSAGLTKYLLDRIRDYAERLRQDELDRIWFETTGTRLPFTEKREMGRFFARLAERFRSMS